MPYTFQPKERYAKVFGRNLKVSTKNMQVLCKVVRKKPLNRVKNLLEGLLKKRRNLKGRYYTNAAQTLYDMIVSCERNAEFHNLDMDRLIVHASAHRGSIMHRRRRKSEFGTRMKSTNLEVMLIEHGKGMIHEKKKMIKKEEKTEKPKEKPLPTPEEKAKKESSYLLKEE